MTDPDSPHPPTDPLAALRHVYLVMSLLLLVQFILGMAVNLFVTIPPRHPGDHPSDYFVGSARSIGWVIPHGGPWLAAHVILGLALIAGGLVGIVLAVRSRRRAAISTASVSGAAIVGAAFNGASFLDFNQDYSSMIMAALFALALGGYILALGTNTLRDTTSANRATSPSR